MCLRSCFFAFHIYHFKELCGYRSRYLTTKMGKFGLIQASSILGLMVLPLIWTKAMAIGCFQCYSFNKSNTICGDPFHPAYGIYKKECKVGRDGRIGEFPAKFCIKLIGNTARDNIELVYRGCSIESLDSQCGEFKYEDVRYRGCVMSCSEHGCNKTGGLCAYGASAFFLQIVTLLSSLRYNQLSYGKL